LSSFLPLATLRFVARYPQRTPGAVAELQGLYGPFSFPEKLLQKIWFHGDFDRSAATTTDGRRLHVLHPGKWNLLGGPDFTGARLRLGDEPEITGEVELHLHATDWSAHAHARDRAYDGVVLHVVLFPPPARHVTRGADGRAIPVLALLPLLHHDLEEFAAEDAVETLAGRTLARAPDELAALDETALAALLRTHAEARWRQKMHFARLRVQRLGWDAACHHMALEILGYRFNRAPMLRIAGRWPLAEWAQGRVNADEVFASEAEADGWSLQGVRPANHPCNRLRQYATWVEACPDWPAQALALAMNLPEAAPTAATRDVRRALGFAKLRARIAGDICGGSLGGTRLDNLVCDGLLPLIVSRGKRDFHGVWFHWFPGDLPPMVARGLRQLGVFDGRVRPACHGLAQGLLGWLLERAERH
jgi:hypothetical protein